MSSIWSSHLRCRWAYLTKLENRYKRFRSSIVPMLPDLISCYSKLNTETGSSAHPTIIVEKFTVKLDAKQTIAQKMQFLNE
ncbi:MAG: hypothetical protein WBA89_16520 [Microcoleus sp.]|uniref:hypothetical protein n=1 Tax=Microcoleus sp. TaxID=44472 RepID=UPI003C75C370